MRRLLPLIFLAACAPEAPPYEPPGPWATLTWTERYEFMVEITQPEMEQMFRDFDPVAYPEVTCATCHGEDGAAVDYAMPNGVAPLAFSDFPFDEHEDDRLREVGIWMEDTVIVRMAEYTGEEVAVDGMSCLDCHELEQFGQ